MKLKITIFVAAILVISANVFGQKADTKPEVKTRETKPSIAASLPTVKEILDKYVQALGGRGANQKIQTRTLKGTVELAPMGIKGTVESYAAAPDKSYNKVSLGGIGDIIESFDGTTAWTVNPIQGNRDKTGDELLQSKIAANFHRELNFETLYPKIEVKGIEKVGDKEAYAVVATTTGLDPQTFYFDRQSGLLLREDATMISPAGKMPVKNYYEDYREIDGVKLPYKIRVSLPQFEITTIITEVKNNVRIDEGLFKKPKE